MNTAESIAIYDRRTDLLIFGVKRSHKFIAQDFCAEMESISSDIKAKNLYIIGDINIDVARDLSDSDLYRDILNGYGLRAGINRPTMIDEYSSSCFDHI